MGLPEMFDATPKISAMPPPSVSTNAISGAAITETVFAWPGVGRLLVNGILNRDYPVVQGIVLVTAIASTPFALMASALSRYPGRWFL